MGLDWILHASKPKPGCEEQFQRINDKLNALDEDESVSVDEEKQLRRDLELALEQVSISPFQIIGAPRVGIDEQATEWFRTQLFEPIHLRLKHETDQEFVGFWSRPYEVVLAEHRGKYVVALAKEREGIAAITGIACGSLDFRGNAVALAEALSEELRNEAYDDHDAEACVAYADRLEAAIENVDDEHVDELIDIRAAVKWLRYWGSRGFGYSGWY